MGTICYWASNNMPYRLCKQSWILTSNTFYIDVSRSQLENILLEIILRFPSSQIYPAFFSWELRQTISERKILYFSWEAKGDCDHNSQLNYLVITIQTYQDVTNTDPVCWTLSPISKCIWTVQLKCILTK